MLKSSAGRRLYFITDMIFQFIVLNLLWFLFTVVGLVAFGVFPASIAVCYLMKKRIVEQDNIPIFSTFWAIYKQNFVRGNILGVLTAAVSFMLYLDFQIIQQFDNMVVTIFGIGLVIVSMFLLITIFYSLPLISITTDSAFKVIKNAFLLGVANPVVTLMIFIVILSIRVIYGYFPTIIPLFGIMPLLLTFTVAFHKSFNKLEQTI
ncbi:MULTISPECIES: DUF624 domain-containing protein [Bacillaceae]|uniref:YesL family protein n=1 Tax=Bacillaceae TaxID=186817 RepID=UPI001BDE0832|nr:MULTISPECIES: DUF624 domain-containing protein [Bacillaceae]MDX8360277.1 DUF624 domain-containing protein [Cytobacillus sp. IB215316]